MKMNREVQELFLVRLFGSHWFFWNFTKIFLIQWSNFGLKLWRMQVVKVKNFTRLSSSNTHGRNADDGGVDGADRDEAGRNAGAAGVDQIKSFNQFWKL